MTSTPSGGIAPLATNASKRSSDFWPKLLHQSIQRGLLGAVTFVVDRGTIRRPLGLADAYGVSTSSCRPSGDYLTFAYGAGLVRRDGRKLPVASAG